MYDTVSSPLIGYTFYCYSVQPKSITWLHSRIPKKTESQKLQLQMFASNKDFGSPIPLSPSASNDCVLPCEDEHNRLQVTWSAVVTVLQRQTPGLQGGGSAFALAAHLYSGGSGCVRRRGWALPLFTSNNLERTPPPFTSPSLSMCFAAFLAQPRQTKKWGGLRGGSAGAQRALCLGSLHMVSFKLAYWTHYSIIYFYI